MPRIAFWSVLSIAALACSLDRDPNPRRTSGVRGDDAGGNGVTPVRDGGAGGDTDAGGNTDKPVTIADAGDGSTGAAGSPAQSPCGDGCPGDTPVCLSPSGVCVQCARDSHCDDPALPVCDRKANACVSCTEDAHCGADAPRCDTEARACVQCIEHDDCDGADAPRCDPGSRTCVRCLEDDDCGEDAPLCDPASNQCVQCLTHADCDAALPQCAQGSCGPCTGQSACKDRDDATLCDTAAGSSTQGSCVECTALDESACDGRVCDPAAQRCSRRRAASKGTCEDCIADSECVGDHRCIRMRFQGAEREQAYCMKRVASGCGRPYASSPIERESLSGAAADAYCGIDEQTTTCEAIAGLLDDGECEHGMDAECEALGGLCRTVNGVENRCTYACEAAAQCPAIFMCGSGYCGGN